MSVEEARAYALLYVNGMRSLRHLDPVVPDRDLTAFAQEGSERLSGDHLPHEHLREEAARCGGCGEVQGDPNGWRVAPAQKQIDEILAGMIDEGPGGGHHDMLLRPEWRRAGVGVVNPGGRLYFTIDFAS